MQLSISAQLPEYAWYIFGGQRGVTFTNSKNKKTLRNGDIFGVRQLKNGTWNMVFPEEIRSIYKITEEVSNRIVLKSKKTKVKIKDPSLIKPQDIEKLDTVVIKGRWDADRFRPAIAPKNEVQVKGDGSDVSGEGINTRNYQWRVLVQDQHVPTKRGSKTLPKGTWIGLRFIKDSQGGKIICRDGFYYNVDTVNYDSLVVDSRLLPQSRWPDLVISPEAVLENRRSARQDYLKQKRELDAKEAAIRRAEREAEKAKEAEKKAKVAAEKAKAKAAEEEFMRTQEENKNKEKESTVTSLKTALDSATKKRKTVKPKEDYHEEDLDDEPDEIGDDDSEQDDDQKKSKGKGKEDASSDKSDAKSDKTKKTDSKKKDDDSEQEDSDDDADSDSDGSSPDDEESGETEDPDDEDVEEEDDPDEEDSDEEEDDPDEEDSEDPDDDDLEEDEPAKDHEATKKLSKALRGDDADDEDLGDEDLGDEEVPDEDDDKSKSKESDAADADEEDEDVDDDDAKKADEEDKKTKNRVGDGKSEEGQVVVFNADTKYKDKYVVLSVDQHTNHDHLLVYRLFKLDSDDDTVKEVRINKQRGQKLTDLCKVVKKVNEKELDALQSKTKDYEVDKKPIKS